MTLRESCPMPQNEPDNDNPDNQTSGNGNPTDALQSKIINAFEAAIDQGMRPVDALAVILSWMTSEMVRIAADQEKQPF